MTKIFTDLWFSVPFRRLLSYSPFLKILGCGAGRRQELHFNNGFYAFPTYAVTNLSKCGKIYQLQYGNGIKFPASVIPVIFCLHIVKHGRDK